MDVRPFAPSDLAACQTLIPSLSPAENYFVMEHEGAILGCGGYQLTSPSEAMLHGCAIHPTWRHQGLGRYGLMFLLKQISNLGPIGYVHVLADASEIEFFLANGFRGNPSEGSRVQLTKRLTVCP
ncbi:MAG: GNAT family N-acetyltransferase [Acidobacteria bacterium]|nr:GNAT family N-acetyltransferase [Acidobacteriota bacterium]